MAMLQKLHAGLIDRPVMVFLHGLGGDRIETWRHESCAPDDCWPHWVGRKTECDVWTVGYDSALSGWTNSAMPLPDQRDQVLDLLSTESELDDRRLVLVGHSMGGLVIKTVMINGVTKGDVRFKALVDRIQAVVFLATPQVVRSSLASRVPSAVCCARTSRLVISQFTMHT